MNSVDFFWMINEIIQENMNEKSESERGVLMETLKEDTGDTVLTFDLANNMEYV